MNSFFNVRVRIKVAVLSFFKILNSTACNIMQLGL
ncbi:hypothetical protein SLEP1_g37801 [Rubroshorea leprosula]|uniref:Uncharacterized protein n=1 Tax=Rubroshorea leprosula TaxID=152421 RepID=A0AAV5KWC7_9ROSI|nr:hypothetical protein SLEP1_g37801 [Rubroshorea leprosula]